MKRLVLVAAVILAAMLIPGNIATAQSKPEFRLGFKALADQVPNVVGLPIENEHWGANGDSLQQTTTGLMAWRKSDNWTAFTNGSRTWVNGPLGVMERGNDERFVWESSDTEEDDDISESEDIPATSTSTSSSTASVLSLFGQPFSSDTVQGFINGNHCRLRVPSVWSGGDATYQCMGKGISLGGSASTVLMIHLFAEGVDDYSAYPDTLPYGLRWGESWSSVLGRLGTPAKQYEPGRYPPFRARADYNVDGARWSSVQLEFSADKGAERKLISVIFVNSRW